MALTKWVYGQGLLLSWTLSLRASVPDQGRAWRQLWFPENSVHDRSRLCLNWSGRFLDSSAKLADEARLHSHFQSKRAPRDSDLHPPLVSSTRSRRREEGDEVEIDGARDAGGAARRGQGPREHRLPLYVRINLILVRNRNLY